MRYNVCGDKKMKILYLEYLSLYGHVCFNKIWVNTLLETDNVKLTLFMPHEIRDAILPEEKISLAASKNIPQRLYTKNNIPFIRFLYNYIRFLWVRNHVNFNDYDRVIVSSFDTLSFFFGSFFLKGKFYLVCHNNISKAAKRPLLKHVLSILAKKYTFIVFEDYIKEYVNNFTKSSNILVIHHGLPNPIKDDNFSSNLIPDPSKYKSIVFCPSSSYIDRFFEDLSCKIDFFNFLRDNNILIIFKTKRAFFSQKNIIFATKRLTDKEYQSLFTISSAILVPYNKDFQYRISAIMLESIANNKIVLCSNIDAFKTYKTIFDYVYTFNDIDSMIRLFETTSFNVKCKRHIPQYLLRPDFDCLFNNHF